MADTKINITAALLCKVAIPYTSIPSKGKIQRDNITRLAPVMDFWLPKYGIYTKLRVAHFLAQTRHETAQFLRLTEIPTNKGEEYEPTTNIGRALGNKKEGDGPKYIGRGLMHLTGYYNNKKYGKALNADLKHHPELVASDPILAVRTGCLYWQTRDINDHADKDDIEKVTRKINGGHNGLKERKILLDRAKKALGI